MQERFCLQLRCAWVSAETEGDKGTGRPISRAVLLLFFLSLLAAQATLIQFGFRDVGLLRRTWVLGNGRSEQGERPRAGPHNLAGDRERKKGDGGGVGVSGFFFPPPAGWVTAEIAHLLCFFPLKIILCVQL